MYREVLDWEPPTAGVRCMLQFGETTLVTQVPEPSTLPPPAPIEVLDQYSELPMLPCASQDPGSLRAAFHEARLTGPLLPFPAACSLLCHAQAACAYHLHQPCQGPRVCSVYKAAVGLCLPAGWLFQVTIDKSKKVAL